MKIDETDIDGAYVIEWQPLEDQRGYFARTRSDETFAAHGLVNNLSECSVSFNRRRATLRGMHYQVAPHQETKLVMCISGRIFDAIVDLRPTSRTFLRSYATELSLENRRTLYVPPGVAHGFITLEDNCYVQYQIGGEYAPEAARGARWDDPKFDIAWPIQPEVISERDRDYESFSS